MVMPIGASITEGIPHPTYAIVLKLKRYVNAVDAESSEYDIGFLAENAGFAWWEYRIVCIAVDGFPIEENMDRIVLEK